MYGRLRANVRECCFRNQALTLNRVAKRCVTSITPAHDSR